MFVSLKRFNGPALIRFSLLSSSSAVQVIDFKLTLISISFSLSLLFLSMFVSRSSAYFPPIFFFLSLSSVRVGFNRRDSLFFFDRWF